MSKKKNRQYEGAFKTETVNTNDVMIERVEEDTSENTDVETLPLDDLDTDGLTVELVAPDGGDIMIDPNPPSPIVEEPPVEEIVENVTVDKVVAQVVEPEKELEDVILEEVEEEEPVLLSPEPPAVSEVTEPEPIDDVEEDEVPEEKSGEFILLLNDGKEPNQNKLIEIENIVGANGLSYDYNVTATGIAYIGPFETEDEAKEVRLEVVRKGLRCSVENKSEVLLDE